MPLYTFVCSNCEYSYDSLLPPSDGDKLYNCPSCGAEHSARKVLSQVNYSVVREKIIKARRNGSPWETQAPGEKEKTPIYSLGNGDWETKKKSWIGGV